MHCDSDQEEKSHKFPIPGNIQESSGHGNERWERGTEPRNDGYGLKFYVHDRFLDTETSIS